MSDTTPSGPEDRVVGLEPVDGFAFESDGTPIGELDVDAPDSLADRGATVAEQAAAERSWRFGHVIVDEAQDLTPMQWRMIARRSHGGGITIVGDLAQRSIGDPGEWADHLPPSLQGFTQQDLTINYRSPAEINDLATTVLADLAPGLAPSRSIRRVGHTPVVVPLADSAVATDSDGGAPGRFQRWLAEHRQARPGRRIAVIGVDLEDWGREAADDGVVWLDPWQAKGLEFDSVVLVEPAAVLDRPHGLSLLYVALTRTTDELTIVHRLPLPTMLVEALGVQ